MTEVGFYERLLALPRPWRVEEVRLEEGKKSVRIWVTHERGGRLPCPHCGREAVVYDHAQEQNWRHLDTCEYQTYLHARLPRVKCEDHGVSTVRPPWSSAPGSVTVKMECRAIDVLKECDVESASRLMRLSWDVLWRIMERSVKRGLAGKERRVPRAIGVDEKSFRKGQDYETVVCDLERGTVEYVGDGRKKKSLGAYFLQFTEEELAGVDAVAMDMWEPFIAATKEHVPDGQNKIVFDRYHVMGMVNKGVDTVRKAEHKLLMEEGDDSLKGTKYIWLSNEENIPETRLPQFEELRRRDLKVSRAWSIKETFRHLWDYKRVGWARRFFKRWYFWATHSRIQPIIDVAKSLKGRLDNILTFIKHGVTNAVAEALNSKIETIKKMACGFRNREHYRIAIYFHCGGLDLYPQAV